MTQKIKPMTPQFVNDDGQFVNANPEGHNQYSGAGTSENKPSKVSDQDLIDELERRSRGKASSALFHHSKEDIKAALDRRGLVMGRDYPRIGGF